MNWKRLLSLFILVVLLGAAFAFRLDKYLTLDAL